MIHTPIYRGLAQSDLDMNHFNLLNFSGSGGATGGDITQLVNGRGYIVITFNTPQADNSWTFSSLVVVNTVDSGPLNILPGTVTAKSATGFTLQLTAAPDSANYYLYWGFTGTGGGTGSVTLDPLPSSATATQLLNSVGMTRTPIAALATSLGNFFDSQSMDPCIIVNPNDSTQLIMIFTGMAAPLESGLLTLGRATASVSNPTVWTVSNGGSPVLTPALVYETAGMGLRADGLLYNPSDGKLYLFYTASESINAATCALASSTDLGLTWTKLGQILTPSGGENTCSGLSVVMEGTTLHAVYSYRVTGVGLFYYRYASASTSNWLSWTKGGVDIYTDSGRSLEFHHLFKVGSTYLLVYESGGTAVDWDIRLATSNSPSSTFTRSTNNPFLVKSGTVGAFDRYHTATPQVMVINGYYYLFYCGAIDHDQPFGNNHWQMGIVPLGS